MLARMCFTPCFYAHWVLPACAACALLVYFTSTACRVVTAKRPAEYAMDIPVDDEEPSQRCLQPVGDLFSTMSCYSEVFHVMLQQGTTCAWHLRAPTRLYRFPPVPGCRWNSTRGRVSYTYGTPVCVHGPFLHTDDPGVSVLVCLSYPVIRPCC